MHQYRGLLNSGCIKPGFEQKTVGRAAALQCIFQLEPQPLWAESPQADQAPVDRQADHLPVSR
ncbi:MAG: Uncharacterised protein [Cyanobium sp. ARS6]|nr:MAG: Uncharacterised protein [Cyanobium sp. ARS6]